MSLRPIEIAVDKPCPMDHEMQWPFQYALLEPNAYRVDRDRSISLREIPMKASEDASVDLVCVMATWANRIEESHDRIGWRMRVHEATPIGMSNATVRISSMASLKYAAVDSGERCPSTSPISLIAAPRRSKLAARAWRKACGPRRPGEIAPTTAS